MANGRILISKPSGGVTTVTSVDGAGNTNLVLPESGTVATEAYADGKTTLAQVKTEISTGRNLVTSKTGALGYGTGAGGTVTQLTSKSTDVTLNKPSGRITMNNAALAAGASVSFVVNNSLYNAAVGDTITADAYMYGANYRVEHRGFIGAFSIRVTNIYGGTLAEPLEINFTIIKGAIS